jgi:C-terminal processing protease CtpA/Prc
MRRAIIVVLTGLCQLILSACGGGDGDGGQSPGDGPTFTPGVFLPSSQFAARCQVPRTGNDPWTGNPWPDQQGSALLEKYFLRSWTHEFYLWADEVLDRNPVNTGGTNGGVLEYFDLLKTTALNDSGQPKDRYHYTYDTNQYRQLVLAGTARGYGISWAILQGAPPRDVRVEYVQAGTPAAQGGVHRGAKLRFVNGYDVVTAVSPPVIDELNTALFAPPPGSVAEMVFESRDGISTFTVNLPAQEIAFDPVPVHEVLDVNGTKVGYLLFNEHTAPAEMRLRSAVQQLADAQVEELVLDLRYNGGGFLDIAGQLAYMIAGPNATAGRTFERRVFNGKHNTDLDPVTGRSLVTPFHSTTLGFSVTAGQSLPSLNLGRVFVLTSSLTCSASESIINGLRGIGIEVIQIGGTTCGKPYGFYPRDNCGTTYFTIQFGSVNDMGFGEFPEGFSATRFTGHPMANLPGCGAQDDLRHELGDPEEGQLKRALHYLTSGGACLPAEAEATAVRRHSAELWPVETEILRKPPAKPWENNRIYR